MPHDPGTAQLLRNDLDGLAILEKHMFGGAAFMPGGHILAGVPGGDALCRVGKPAMARAFQSTLAPSNGV